MCFPFRPSSCCSSLYFFAFMRCCKLNASRLAPAMISLANASAPAEMLAMVASLRARRTSMLCTTCWTCCSYSFTTLCCSATCTCVIESSKLVAKSTFIISNLVATTLPCCHNVWLIWSSIFAAILWRFFQNSWGVKSCAVLLTMLPARSRYRCLAASKLPKERYTSRSALGTNWNCTAQEITMGWPPLSGSLGSAPVRVGTGGRSIEALEKSRVVCVAGNPMMPLKGPVK
mmetsp:Transcript_69426/g.157535  ORF Transcript_69426/g.157535 Transcript_69426/m.157535 type:complete len:231 (+) Transcript_69426:215-907(+)